MDSPIHLETDRLIIRHFANSDAVDVYEYGSHPDVGPRGGWEAHASLENTQELLANSLGLLNQPNRCFEQDFINPYLSSKHCKALAIVLRETGKVIGSVGYKDFLSSSTFDFARDLARHPLFPEMARSYEDSDSILDDTDFTDLKTTNEAQKQTDEEKLKAIAHQLIFGQFDQTRFDPEIAKLYPNGQLSSSKSKPKGQQTDSESNMVPESNENSQPKPTGLRPPSAHLCNLVEIGFALNPSFWGKGYMPEAVKCLIYDFILPQIKPVGVLILAYPDNVQSKRVAEKVGAVFVAHYEREIYQDFDDTTHDVDVQILLNWSPSVKETLG